MRIKTCTLSNLSFLASIFIILTTSSPQFTMGNEDKLERKVKLMERQFKVVQVDKKEDRVPMMEEVEELARVNAEIAEAGWATEDDIIAAAEDKRRVGGSPGTQRAVAQKLSK